jgi:rSAM/selenodomain-associated transferase 1
LSAHILVITKEPLPGVSKTRLSPPCSPAQAAAVARAALEDTLETVAATPAISRTVILQGRIGDWLPHGFAVVPQRGKGLAERLAAAFTDCPAPAFLLGMDTPQVTPALLMRASTLLTTSGVDAVLGPTEDGGYWTIGFQKKVPDAFEGVPMSSGRTLNAQLSRLKELALTVEILPSLRDLDRWQDAQFLARSIPGSRVARTVTRIEHDLIEISA